MLAEGDGSTSKLRGTEADGMALVYDVRLCGSCVRVKS